MSLQVASVVHNGLPVMTYQTMQRMLRNLNFLGYVQYPDGTLAYTNNIRQETEDIFVSAFGAIRKGPDGKAMESQAPEDTRGYGLLLRVKKSGKEQELILDTRDCAAVVQISQQVVEALTESLDLAQAAEVVRKSARAQGIPVVERKQPWTVAS